MDTNLILDFLGDLGQNNHKEWMDANKPTYKKAKEAFENLTTHILNELVQIDPSLEGITAKQSIFRINRDIRFSKDKRPYKENMGAFMAEGGRKSWHAGYYVHLQPGGNTMVGGGIYMPPNDVLNKIRQEIDYNTSDFLAILEADDWKKHYGEIKGDRLKTAPKGYPKDHPHIELLKMKSYVSSVMFTDEEVRQAGFPAKVIEAFGALAPFNGFLNRAVHEVGEGE